MIACNESLSGCFNAPIHHQVWPSIQLFHKMIRPDHWFCNYKDESMQLIRFSGSTIHLPKIEYVFIAFFNLINSKIPKNYEQKKRIIPISRIHCQKNHRNRRLCPVAGGSIVRQHQCKLEKVQSGQGQIFNHQINNQNGLSAMLMIMPCP